MPEYETRQCEHCGKDVNVQSVICPLCGGRIRENVLSSMPVCPRCEIPLVPHAQGGEAYDICKACGGQWLDRVEFKLATRESEVYSQEVPKTEYLRAPPKDPLTYIPCVRCGKIMNRKNFSKISGVLIDECGKHGVWLDAGEMEKIRHFIADGGLERAQDMKVEKNRTELKRLATQVDTVAFSHKLIHFWNLKRWLFGG